MAFLDTCHPMSAGTPDTSLLSKLLRDRIASSRQSPAPVPDVARDPLPEDIEQRSSAVIGALMRDTRDAFEHQRSAHPAADPAPAEPAPEAPTHTTTDTPEADDLSAFLLDTLDRFDWPEWVTARCDFPEHGPFVADGCDDALSALAALTQQVFADAGEDGDDLSVEIFAGSETGSARMIVSGPFSLSMKTLKLIMHSRNEIEAIGGALITVRTADSAGFEALIPEQQ